MEKFPFSINAMDILRILRGGKIIIKIINIDYATLNLLCQIPMFTLYLWYLNNSFSIY